MLIMPIDPKVGVVWKLFPAQDEAYFNQS